MELTKEEARELAERLQREQRAPTKEELAAMAAHSEPLNVERYTEKLRKVWGDDAPDPLPAPGDWRAELRAALGEEDEALPFLEAVVERLGAQGAEAVRVAGRALDFLGRANLRDGERVLDTFTRREGALPFARRASREEREEAERAPEELAQDPALLEAMAAALGHLDPEDAPALAALLVDARTAGR